MPNRILRDGILESERIHRVGPMPQLFYRCLMSIVDDYGRYACDIPVLLSRCFPRRPIWADEEMVSLAVEECRLAGLIITYEVNGRRYLEICDFRQNIRAKASKWPAPATQTHSTCIADAIPMHSETETESESESKPARSARAGCGKPQMPPKTIRTDAGREYPNPTWVEAQKALRENREAIARARDPVAYETAILRRVVGA